jgi:hypothetical protein
MSERLIPDVCRVASREEILKYVPSHVLGEGKVDPPSIEVFDAANLAGVQRYPGIVPPQAYRCAGIIVAGECSIFRLGIRTISEHGINIFELLHKIPTQCSPTWES